MLKVNWMDGQRSASSKLKFSGKNNKTLNSPCWNQQERQLEVQALSASPSHGKEEIGGLPHQPFSLHTQLVLLKVLFLVIVILLWLQSLQFAFLSWHADVLKNVEVAGTTKCTSRNLSLLLCVD